MAAMIFIVISISSGCVSAHRTYPDGTDAEKERIAYLIRSLDDPDPIKRKTACRRLGEGKAEIAVKPLIKALKDKDIIVQAEAAWALGEIRDEAAIQPLIELLLKEDRRPKSTAASPLAGLSYKDAVVAAAREHNIAARSAVEALDKFHNPVILEPLIKALEDSDRIVRAGAAKALSAYSSPKVVMPLIRLLGDEAHEVRDAVVSALAAIGREVVGPLIDALQGNDLAADGAARALSMTGAAAVEPLALLVKGGKEDLRAKAVSVMSTICIPGVSDHLGPLLHDPSSKIRLLALEGFGCSQDPLTAAIVLESLGDRDESVRKAAVEVLNRKTVYNRAALFYGLESRNQYVRAGSISVLASQKERKAFGLLSKLASTDPEPMVRAAAVSALGDIEDPRAKTVLLKALEDRDTGVRIRASQLLSSLTGKDFGMDAKRWREWLNDNSLAQPASLGTGYAAAAIQTGSWQLSSEDPAGRSEAALEMGRRRDPGASTQITGLLKDSDPVVRWSALAALSMLSPAEVLPSIAEALWDSHWLVRCMAAETLGKMKDSRALEPLITALNDENESVRISVADALGEIGHQTAFEPLRRIQKGMDIGLGLHALIAMKRIDPIAARPIIRHEIGLLTEAIPSLDEERLLAWVHAMAMLEDEAAVDALTALMKSTSLGRRVRRAAADALIKTGAHRIDIYMGLLRDSDEEIRSAAYQALRRMQTNFTYETLAEAMKQHDPAVRKWIREDLRGYAHENINKALMVLLKDERDEVRNMAKVLLSSVEDSDRLLRLEAALKDPSAAVRAASAEILGKFKSPRAAAALFSALKDGSREVRRAAVSGLNEFSGYIPSDILIAAMKDDSSLVRVKAVQLLARGKETASLPLIIDALRDGNEHVRAEAVRALGMIRDRDGIEPLISLLEDKAYIVRRAAAEALASITGMNFGLAGDRWAAWWRETAKRR